MTAISGVNGSVKIGANTIAELDNFDISIDADMLKTTHFGDTWKRQIAGILSWNGKASGRWDMTDTTGQKALQDAELGGTTVSLIFTTTTGKTYTGTCWVKNISIKAVADSTVDVDFSFEGTDELVPA